MNTYAKPQGPIPTLVTPACFPKSKVRTRRKTRNSNPFMRLLYDFGTPRVGYRGFKLLRGIPR
jgi:hypothetical protein